MTSLKLRRFRRIVWAHYRTYGRDLPWRRTRNPYHILISEVMLQQTQVNRVLEYYPKFTKRFPDFRSLSHSPLPILLSTWQGLGYNRRAIALRTIGKIVTSDKYNGELPTSFGELVKLPGIGPATAGAILAYAWNKPVPFIETNIRRVFIHHFSPKRKKVSDSEILPLVAFTMSQTNPRAWYWALMDYGAHLARQVPNPNRRSKHYARQSPFPGSNRELRGKIVRSLLKVQTTSIDKLAKELQKPEAMIRQIVQELSNEGFTTSRREAVRIAENHSDRTAPPPL